MVDSSPWTQRPPSTINGMRPSSSRQNMRCGCRADPAKTVGTRRSNRPAIRSRDLPKGRMGAHPQGHRVLSGSYEIGHQFRPWQDHRERTRPERFREAEGELVGTCQALQPFKSERCTISGSLRGRSFASKIFAQARGSSAAAPSPYTVSVGNATSAPEARSLAASSRPSGAVTTRVFNRPVCYPVRPGSAGAERPPGPPQLPDGRQRARPPQKVRRFLPLQCQSRMLQLEFPQAFVRWRAANQSRSKRDSGLERQGPA